MRTKKFITGFVITFVLALIANIVVTICWSYFVKGEGMTINWGSSFTVALVLALVIPFTQSKLEK